MRRVAIITAFTLLSIMIGLGQMAQKEKIEVIIANGKNLNNLDNILSGQPFTGTTVSPT